MIRICSVLFLLMFLCGCRVLPPEDGYNVNNHELSGSDPRLCEVGEELLQSIRDGDYSRFSALANRYGDPITEDDFRLSGDHIRRQFGKICNYEYLTDLEIPLLHNLIGKVGFERVGKQKEAIRQELLFRLVLGTENGVPRIISMGFL